VTFRGNPDFFCVFQDLDLLYLFFFVVEFLDHEQSVDFIERLAVSFVHVFVVVLLAQIYGSLFIDLHASLYNFN